LFFFFQAEDGIRDGTVTGVQTCALPICTTSVDEAGGVPDPAQTPDQALVAREERDRVRSAVAGLPELYRVPVVLRYFSELSIEEIAALTGRPSSTVGVQLLRGRALLRV